MSDLMPASIAREIVNQMLDVTSQRLQAEAKGAIEGAAREGKSTVSLNIPGSHVKRMKEWLESLGYKVEAGDCQRDGSWFNVSW